MAIYGVSDRTSMDKLSSVYGLLISHSWGKSLGIYGVSNPVFMG